MADSFAAARPDPRPRARRRPRPATPDSRLVLATSTRDRGVVVLTVAGEIDLANRATVAAALAEATADPGTRLLVCDLSQVTFLACTGLSALLDARSELDRRGARLRVVTRDRTVLRVLAVTGQLGPLGVCPDLVEALTDDTGPPPAAPAPLTQLRTTLDDAVERTTTLAARYGRLADQVVAVDTADPVDERGGSWATGEALGDLAEELRGLRDQLARGALLSTPAVDDGSRRHGTGSST